MSDSDSDSFHSASEGEYFDDAEDRRKCCSSEQHEEVVKQSNDVCMKCDELQFERPKQEASGSVALVNGDNAFESFVPLQSKELRTSEVEGNYTNVSELSSLSNTVSRDNSAFELATNEQQQRHTNDDKGGKDKRSDSSGKDDSKSSKSDGWDEWDEEHHSDNNNEEDTSGWEKWDTMESELSAEQSPIENEKRATKQSGGINKSQQVEQGDDKKTGDESESTRSSLWTWTDISGAVAAVGEGISNVVESSLGLPSPEEMVKRQIEESKQKQVNEEVNVGQSLFGGFITGIGSNLVTGSLDVLESLGKKTFEKLTVQREGSARRRLIFEQDEGQNLSDVLKGLRGSQRTEQNMNASDSSPESNRETTFIDLFEKYGGLVHLEGLEMLSENFLKRLPIEKRREVQSIMKEALSEGLVDSHEDEDFSAQLNRVLATIGLPYNGSNLIECEKRCRQRCQMLSMDPRIAFTDFLEIVAELTANSVETMHKLGQLMLIGVRRPSEKSVCELLALIGRRISFFSNEYADHLNSMNDNIDSVEELVTTVFLSANDAFVYVQQSTVFGIPLRIYMLVAERGPEKAFISNVELLRDSIEKNPSFGDIHHACACDFDDAIMRMCSEGDAQVVVNEASIDGRLPLQIAADNDKEKALRILIQFGADVSKQDSKLRNVLHYAAQKSPKMLEILKASARFGVAMDQVDEDGMSPVCRAIQASQVECVKLLLDSGCSVGPFPAGPLATILTLADSPQQLPMLVDTIAKRSPNFLFERIHGTSTILHEKMENVLLYHILEGAGHNLDVNVRDGLHQTPLHCSARRNDLAQTIALLAFGANVNAVDQNGETALHIAAQLCSLSIVKLLLCFNASVTLRNNGGLLAIDLAKHSSASDKKEIISCLQLFATPPPHSNPAPENVLSSLMQAHALSRISAMPLEQRGRLINVLALDGGGIRGLILVQILLHIENQLGYPIMDHFKWLAGTSTGAILALALARGDSLRVCQSLYLRLKDEIFCGNRPYSEATIEHFLQAHFGDICSMADKP
ncbi:85/88 kDa calcium-independent phospholipase A2 [Toxocara canis]|uniref:phospholipase A2 n=1 Tax=Toxocara canis TaxID=6265 RepID=A0A0B2VHB2_TOXCA|nr:85/88 kDa calcium-independent phospholipase A2 [Toxocara canis]